MIDHLKLDRRKAMALCASFPLAGGLAQSAVAKADMLGATRTVHHRFKLGSFEVTTLLAGSRPRDEIQKIFGTNVSSEEFARVSAENQIPADRSMFYFTPTVVNTGSELILFDTGLNAGGISEALESAGYSVEDVDTVVITHMHGDHIGGLLSDGSPTFPNARYVTGSAEFNHWSAAENERFEGNVRPLADQFAFLDDGGAVSSGVTAMAAFGHTPGHMGYMIESDGKQLMLIADAANHPVWSVGYPDWEVRFDADKAAAAATRRKIFGMLSADGIPFVGYHMPFPAVGFVAPREDGFRYIPASYQLDL